MAGGLCNPIHLVRLTNADGPAPAHGAPPREACETTYSQRLYAPQRAPSRTKYPPPRIRNPALSVVTLRCDVEQVSPNRAIA